MSARVWTAGVALLALSAGTLAAPPGMPTSGTRGASGTPVMPEGPGWTDNFDTYTVGPLAGQGGWAVWCSGGADGAVSTQQAASAPNSFRASPGSDMVQTFSGINSGKWVFKVKTYVPSTATGSSFVIALNNYCATVNQDWSITMEMNAGTGLAGIYLNGVPNGATLPLITNQWVEYRAEFDLSLDTLKEYYNGTLFSSTPQTWTGNVLAGGMLNFAAIDLYSSTMDGAFYDDLSVLKSCYPDCNGSGGLTIADFACFQNQFVQQTAYGDCNNSGTWTIADFPCFQNAFVTGCP